MSDAITVQDLTKEYGTKRVVDNVSFAVREGEIFGLLGPNGAGKSTTIECLVGLRETSAGTIEVLGMPPGKNRREFAEQVAIQPQSASLVSTLSVDETLKLFGSFYADSADPSVIREQVGLEEQGGVRVKHLSGGQLRRLLLAVALIGKPDVVVLDEPSAGLDPSARQSLWKTIRDLAAGGTTVLLSTHHMDEATELCDRVGILVGGQLVALDTPEQLILARDAETTVSFSVARGTDLSVLSTLAADDSITVEEGGQVPRVRIRSSDPDVLIRKLTFTPGLGARDYDIKRGTLEDLFLELSAKEMS